MAEQVEIELFEVAASSLLAGGYNKQALGMMESAAQMEDGTGKSAITPGPLAPARELLGEMLLEMKKPAEALAHFEATLKKEPHRLRALYGAAIAAQRSGNSAASNQYFSDFLKVCERADKPPRPELLEAKRRFRRIGFFRQTPGRPDPHRPLGLIILTPSCEHSAAAADTRPPESGTKSPDDSTR